MKGLDLSRRYFTDCVLPELKRSVPGLVGSIAFGLVGPGSECYGFDDEHSRDHDWGPRVCLWVPESMSDSDAKRLQKIYESLPQEHLGYGPVKRLDTRVRRDGVIPARRFYETFLGTARPPETLREWLVLTEEAFSVCTNGEVFKDDPGEFSAFRGALNAYFPDDIRLKKISSRLKAAGQHGQYNIVRAWQRTDTLAIMHHTAAFTEETARLGYLLERTYRPHAKWLYRGLLELGERASRLVTLLSQVMQAVRGGAVIDIDAVAAAIDTCATFIAAWLEQEGLPVRPGAALYDLGVLIEGEVQNAMIREGIDRIE